ncbi:hypothetical protein D0Z00_001042 [Geotrichum galactomycetum]|uniref:Uncharacterized protein n=1 Tax=Geotrichum galactomycetum TaxID=27317 RepID=A0ACB6V8H2_9ASCO|nr:hypothetical protein D0Z00_001042 [Geotrichum candidum]
MLHALQSTLSSLHAGTNPEFLEQLADLEERRDQELLRLRLWEQYRIDRTETEYQREVEAANEEYGRLTLLVKERLMERLENQRKSLREDKALLDIANDHMVFLNSAYANGGSGYYSSNYHSNSINNSTLNVNNSGPYTNNNSSANNNNGNNSNTEDQGNLSTRYGNGYYSGGGGAGSPGFYASERRHLRRRGDHGTTSALDDVSGMSGNEGRSGYGSAAGRRTDGGGAGAGSASKRRKVGGRGLQSGGEDGVLQSDKETLEGILFHTNNGGANGTGSTANGGGGGHHHSSISRPSKSYQSPAALKSEDVQNDLTQLRVAVSSIRRKRGEK